MIGLDPQVLAVQETLDFLLSVEKMVSPTHPRAEKTSSNSPVTLT
jgi:hypothetical protein